MMQRVCETELQKRAGRADQLVLIFFFWEMRAKNRATMSILGYFWSILDLIFVANFCGRSRLVSIFTSFATMLEGAPCSVMA